ncbi:MAG: DUF6569 family protein [Tepidisphaeraceae bacterium]
MVARLLWVVAVVVSLSSSVSATRPAALDEIHVVGPYVSGNLTVYLVRGPNLLGDKKYLTLSEGLEQKKVIVYEKQQVNELSVENLSDQDLYLQAGEIVKGGQQDRTLGRDMVVSAHSGQVPIGANCVEHGRWTQRGSESQSQFAASPNALASKELKQANYSGDQQGVWDKVSKAQEKLAANAPSLADAGGTLSQSPTSLELTVEDKAVASAAEAYEKGVAKNSQAFPDVIGFVFAINGKLNSGDVYASDELFGKMYPKLLHAAAVEALAEREPNSDQKVFDAPKPEAVEAMIKAVDIAKGEPQPMDAIGMEQQINQEAQMPQQPAARPVADRAVILKKQTNEVEMYETRDTETKAPFLHRAYLTK